MNVSRRSESTLKQAHSVVRGARWPRPARAAVLSREEACQLRGRQRRRQVSEALIVSHVNSRSDELRHCGPVDVAPAFPAPSVFRKAHRRAKLGCIRAARMRLAVLWGVGRGLRCQLRSELAPARNARDNRESAPSRGLRDALTISRNSEK